MKVIVDINKLPCKMVNGVDSCINCPFLDAVKSGECIIPKVLSFFPELKKNVTTKEDLNLTPKETLCEYCEHEDICRITQYGEPYRTVRKCYEFMFTSRK